jgi:hypothetical protein
LDTVRNKEGLSQNVLEPIKIYREGSFFYPVQAFHCLPVFEALRSYSIVLAEKQFNAPQSSQLLKKDADLPKQSPGRISNLTMLLEFAAAHAVLESTVQFLASTRRQRQRRHDKMHQQPSQS